MTFSGDAGGRLEANSDRRWRESRLLRERVEGLTGPVVLAGDFNTTDDSPIFRENWGAYADAFAQAGWGLGYTYRNSHTQIRIDHILAGRGARIAAFHLGPDVGSPHLPLVADINFR